MASRDEAMRRLVELMRDSADCSRRQFELLRDKLNDLTELVRDGRRRAVELPAEKKRTKLPWEQIFKYGPHILYLAAIGLAHWLGRWWIQHVH